MKENGEEIKERDMEFKNGLMGQDMRVNGKKIKLMGKVNFFTSMEMFLKENGNKIKQMVMGPMFT